MPPALDPATSLGVVSLSVADLPRSLAYYQQEIGLSVVQQEGRFADLGVGKTVLLRLHEFPGARHVRRATGLYHVALLLPSRRDLARVILHFAEQRTRIDSASDHAVSEALYLSDPDGHGIEIYRDRPRSDWYDAQGKFLLTTMPIDIEGIMGELHDDAPAWDGLPPETTMGHVHLQVADLSAAEQFYLEVLGFERMARMPSASFISTGGYHHHLGMNTWAGVGVPPPPEHSARLLDYELVLPNRAALEPVLERVQAAGIALTEQANRWSLRDPSHNQIILRCAA